MEGTAPGDLGVCQGSYGLSRLTAVEFVGVQGLPPVLIEVLAHLRFAPVAGSASLHQLAKRLTFQE